MLLSVLLGAARSNAQPDVSAGTLQFSAASYSVSETGGVATITVNRTGGSLGMVTVDYQTDAGTATADLDYTPQYGTLTFADGVTNQTFQVPILNDTTVEGLETLQLSLSNPQGGASLGTLASVTLTIVDDDVPPGPNVNSYVLGKGQRFTQPGPGAPMVSSNQLPYQFTSFVEPAFAGAVVGAWLRLPNGVTNVMTDDDDHLQFKTNLATKALLDARFPTGAYRFLIQTFTDGARSLGLSLPADAYPPIPHLSNWAAVQQLDASGDFTFTWDSFTGGSTNDFVHLTIEDDMHRTVSESPGFLELRSLHGLDTAFTLRANSLAPLQTYQGRLLFLKRTGLNLTAYPGVTGLSGYYRETLFPLTTTEAPPPAGRFRFSSPTYSVSETGGVAMITVLRSGGSLGEATVDYATDTGGTATPGADFTPAADTLRFLDGETSKDCFISILDDFVLEGTETVRLLLRNPTGGADLGKPTNAVLSIIDNEIRSSGVIQFSSAQYTVAESGPVANITLTRSGGFAGGVTVDFSTSDGSATAGLDYSNVVRTISFGVNQTNRTVAIPIINDTLDETNETVLLSLRNPTGGASLGPRSSAVLIIADNDSGGAISFSAAAYSVSETGRLAKIIINRSGGAASAVSVEFATSDGSATAGVDYDGVTNVLLFAANELSKTNFIAITDDTLPEGNETVSLTLRNPTGGATLGAISHAVLNIIDDEIALQFSRDTYTNNEAAGGAPITIIRSGPLSGAVSVTLSTGDGTASSGLDYRGVNTNLTLGAGIASRTFLIPIINDTIVDSNETVNLFLSNPVGAQLGGRANATLFIVDNDAGGIIQFSATNYTVTEAGPAARITVIRTSGLAGAVGVDFRTAEATALAGNDYIEVVTNIVFATNETSKTILIPILNDATVEPAETVQLSLSNPSGGGSLGPRSSATLTILDNDVGGAMNFSTAAYAVSENGGLATITVNRSGGTAEVSVAYSTLNGTATPDVDYVATSGTLVFGSNIFKQTFQVQINDNSDAGGNKTVLLQLSDPTGSATLGATRNAVLTIKDDEINVQGVYNVSGSITASGCTFPEDNGTRTFTGQVRFTDQVNHDFLGTATLLSSAGQAIEVTNISGTFDSAGKISGAYDWNNDNGDHGSGTLNGTIIGTNLQISFHGSEAADAGDTCQHNGSLAGKLYVSPANGFAPADLQSASLTAGIVFSGALNAGTFYFDSAGPDTYDFEPVDPDTGVYSYGLYLYTRTGPNTASLKLVDTGEGLYQVINLTFQSADSGVYTIGTQSGSFSVAR